MDYRLRIPEEEDWLAIFSVAMQAVPDSKAENEEWWENRKAIDDDQQRRRHYVVEDERDHVVGYGAIEEGPDPGLFRMFVVGSPEIIKQGLGETLYSHLMSELNDLGARIVWIQEESRDSIVQFFLEKGFRERTRFMLENGREAIVLYLELGSAENSKA
ncbi:MAG: GNAT family N-acetyltransferase, partial [Anaerolineales bacterium]